ncbi:TnsD family transposase [Salipaludibacillus neizhouensis]|nr:TnsD family transposase [Salipaludibacillus neizhouensis]
MFPQPYEDEMLYSTMARYHIKSGNNSYKRTLIDLLGSNSKVATPDLPSNLNSINEHTISNLNPDYLITNHTLYPYYNPFIASASGEKVREYMSGNENHNVHMLSGITASGVKNTQFFRFCIKCYENDCHKFGEPYWRRVHQLPHVFICPIHSEPLKQSNVPFTHQPKKQKYYALSEINIGYAKDINISPNHWHYYDFLSRQSARLLWNESDIPTLGLARLRSFYQNRLNEKGFITLFSTIRFNKLLPNFISIFEENFLRNINCLIFKNSEDTWLHKILRKPRGSSHPLRHLLLLYFLGENVDAYGQMNTKNLKNEPFGSSPFPCLNQAAEHYHEDVVDDYNVTKCYETGKPVGTFTCSCGFVYSRRGPDKDYQDRFRIGRIKSFGDVWNKKLSHLHQQNLTITQIAKELGVDRGTIKKYLLKLEDACQQNQENLMEPSMDSEEYYKKRWMDHLATNSKLSRTELRKQLPSVYTWLYRHDKQWLFNNLPPKMKRGSNNQKRVDWTRRDEELSVLIDKEAELIKTKEGKLQRVTISRIGKQLGASSLLEKNLNHLPLCRDKLQNITESIEEFQMRRLKTNALELRNLSIEVSEWRLIRESGLKIPLASSLQEAILKEVRE